MKLDVRIYICCLYFQFTEPLESVNLCESWIDSVAISQGYVHEIYMLVPLCDFLKLYGQWSMHDFHASLGVATWNIFSVDDADIQPCLLERFTSGTVVRTF